MEKFEIEEKIVAMLKTVYDPEIPVNVYDLGLIYKIDVSDNGEVVLDMTLTAPNCPAADFIMEDIRQKIESVEGVNSATINLVSISFPMHILVPVLLNMGVHRNGVW